MTWSKEALEKELFNNSCYIFKNGIWKYIGNRGNRLEKPMHFIAKRSYQSWIDQGKRCTNPKNQDYKYYGAKEVKRIWTAKECIDWYINELLKRNKWICPVISRLGDIGDYKTGNVKLIETTENTIERKMTENRRKAAVKNGRKVSKPLKAYNIINADDVCYFNSIIEASIYFKKGYSNFSKCIYKKSLIKYKNKKYRVDFVEVAHG